MSGAGGTRTRTTQRGAVLLGLAGGMLVVAGGLVGGYYVLGTRSVASAATLPTAAEARRPDGSAAPANGLATEELEALLAREVELVTPTGKLRTTWRELGAEIDLDEARRAGAADHATLAARGSLPVRLDRARAIEALTTLKAKTDRAPNNAYLDLEERVIHEDAPGQGLDVWGSLPRLAGAARQGAPSLELAAVAMPATVTRESLGIEDISHVLGTHVTRFSVADKDRNFNLKLAASKLHGVVLRPGEELSFNDTVGERSQRMGYKVAHVIQAGEMVDGLAGGTCQISTTLFGAAFFAGIDIVRTINHSRPSAYTPLAFDATVVWPNVDLKIRNSYDFPVVIRYVVANGEAKVEILGKERPYDKIVFERKVIEESPFPLEERLDPEMQEGAILIDQEGFPGYKLERYRKFFKKGKLVKKDKWLVTYKPVTEYIRRGTNPDPNAPAPEQKPHHGPKKPKTDEWSMAQ